VPEYHITQYIWDGDEWIVVFQSPTEDRNCDGGPTLSLGFIDGEKYQIIILPLGAYADHFDPIDIQFDPVDCATIDSPLELEFPLKAGGSCACTACGIPVESPAGGMTVNGVAMTKGFGNTWAGCATYAVPSFKWCRTLTHDSSPCYGCPDWGTYNVPVRFEFSFNCLGGAQLNIVFPGVRWFYDEDCANNPPEPTPATDCDDVGVDVDTLCKASTLPAWTNSNQGTCYNHWRLLGDLSCANLPCVFGGPGAVEIPDCPGSFECDPPSPLYEGFLVQESFGFSLDCEAEDPFAIEIEVDFGPRTGCICHDGSIPGTGHETVNHPLAAIFGTTATFTISRT
jgi:hypothetical protein